MRNAAGIAAHKERFRIGAAIADALPKHKTLDEVADIMGLSFQQVRNIECMALWKIQQAMKEFTRGDMQGAAPKDLRKPYQTHEA